MYFDMNYLLAVFIPTIIISGLAQMWIRSAFNRWSQVPNGTGLTGERVAQAIIQRTDLGNAPNFSHGGGIGGSGISLQYTPGQLTDHYDPRTHTVRMSDATAGKRSVVAMAVVAHELGHAQQHENRSPLIAMRNILVPAVSFSPRISYLLIFVGLFFNMIGALWLGIFFFGLTVLFALLTVPVEIDASRRGLKLLDDAGLMVTEQDKQGSRAILTAAGSTYIAAAVSSLLTLLYYLSLANSRNRR